MNLTGRWVLSIFLVFISIITIIKGIELWSLGTNVDGNGIGIYFLGLELNDSVTEASIPNYAIGFIITSILAISIALILIRKAFINSSENAAND